MFSVVIINLSILPEVMFIAIAAKFCRVRRIGRFGYKMVPPGKVQIPDFTNKNAHKEVIMQGAQAGTWD